MLCYVMMSDLRLPSQPQHIAAPRLVPNYTAWWQKTMCTNCEQLAQGQLSVNIINVHHSCRSNGSFTPDTVRCGAARRRNATHRTRCERTLTELNCELYTVRASTVIFAYRSKRMTKNRIHFQFVRKNWEKNKIMVQINGVILVVSLMWRRARHLRGVWSVSVGFLGRVASSTWRSAAHTHTHTHTHTEREGFCVSEEMSSIAWSAVIRAADQRDFHGFCCSFKLVRNHYIGDLPVTADLAAVHVGARWALNWLAYCLRIAVL